VTSTLQLTRVGNMTSVENLVPSLVASPQDVFDAPRLRQHFSVSAAEVPRGLRHLELSHPGSIVGGSGGECRSRARSSTRAAYASASGAPGERFCDTEMNN
jgi:hypothetical protein